MVAPAKVMASPILSIKIERRKHKNTRANVTKALTFVFIPDSLKKSSSTVSLAGNTHNGAAVNTAKNNANYPYRAYVI